MGIDIDLHVERKNSKGVWEHISDDLYTERSYMTYAILADVRNGFGEGCNYAFEPISKPKGLPNDATDQTIRDADAGFAHSFFTLRELFEFDWDQTITVPSGWVSTTIMVDLPYREAAKDFLDVVIPELKRLSTPDDVNIGITTPDDVRIVFWFS